MNTDSVPISQKQNASYPIYSITPFTLLDYPDKTACIIWFAGCNMRCLYCYNPDIVLGKGTLSFDKAISFLKSRRNLLDGVVFSGGECLLHKNIVAFMERVKALGFAIKIDTNGTKPIVLQKLINANAIDYVALDFKALPGSFEKITQSKLFSPFEKSLQNLLQSNVQFEIRTTVHSALITEADLKNMIRYLEQQGYIGNHYVQYFQNGVPTLKELGYSSKGLEGNLSTDKITVIFRG